MSSVSHSYVLPSFSMLRNLRRQLTAVQFLLRDIEEESRLFLHLFRQRGQTRRHHVVAAQDSFRQPHKRERTAPVADVRFYITHDDRVGDDASALGRHRLFGIQHDVVFQFRP